MTTATTTTADSHTVEGTKNVQKQLESSRNLFYFCADDEFTALNLNELSGNGKKGVGIFYFAPLTNAY